MGVKAFNPAAYGKLLAAELPKAIKTEKDFERVVEKLEALDFPQRKLTPEEEALRELLAALVEVYDEENYDIPDAQPHEVVQHLMEERNLKPTHLVGVIGDRTQVSDLLSGKQEISRAQAKKLAEFFRVAPELFA